MRYGDPSDADIIHGISQANLVNCSTRPMPVCTPNVNQHRLKGDEVSLSHHDALKFTPGIGKYAGVLIDLVLNSNNGSDACIIHESIQLGCRRKFLHFIPYKIKFKLLSKSSSDR